MPITVQEAAGVFVVSGELDLGSAEEFHHQVAGALDEEGEVVLDLGGLTFIDSFGLRTIALLARMIDGRGVVLRSPRAEVLRVLELIDIESIPGIRVEPT